MTLISQIWHRHIHSGITVIHLESFTLSLPQSSMCSKLLGATYISLKQKPSGLDHLTLPKIHCHFASLDRFFSAVCTGHWKIEPCLTSCDTWSWCQVISKKIDVFSDLASVFLTLVVCQLTHQICQKSWMSYWCYCAETSWLDSFRLCLPMPFQLLFWLAASVWRMVPIYPAS